MTFTRQAFKNALVMVASWLMIGDLKHLECCGDIGC